MGDVIEIRFPIEGTRTLPVTFAYPLFGALCKAVPELHGDTSVLINVLHLKRSRTLDREGWVALTRETVLAIRAPTSLFPSIGVLAEKMLEVQGVLLRLGTPRARSLEPASVLRSGLVIFSHGRKSLQMRKGLSDEDSMAFGMALGRLFEKKDISAQLGEPGPSGWVMIKGMRNNGFALELTGLSDEDSMAIQTNGLGGRRHFGAGWFEPVGGRDE